MCNVDLNSIQNGALEDPWVTPGACLRPLWDLPGSTRRPSRNIVFYDTKSTFLLFVFSRSSQKKHRKIAPKFRLHVHLPKNTKKWTRGPRFGSQNGPELTSESPKIFEMLQKSCVLTLQFFEPISRREKTRFCQFLVPKR